MKEFGALLKEFMTEADVSINHFATEIQLDRGWLYAVFQGKKDLPEEKLSMILSMDYFSEPQKRELREAFYIGFFGISGYKQVRAIEAGFKACAEKDAECTVNKIKSDITLDPRIPQISTDVRI